MIEANHRRFFVWFIKVYTSVNLRLSFRKVVVEGDTVVPADKPLLLIGNHFSWWDGFFAYYLNDILWRRKFHVMMLEEQLQTRLFLNKVGAYSVRRGSRSVIDSLNYTSRLLKTPGNLVVIYPQGEISSLYTYPVRFERGIDRIIRSAGPGITVLFYVALVDWFSSKKPSLTFRLRKFEYVGTPGHDELEEAFNRLIADSIAAQIPEKA
ncbi:MAG: lysophospholipid acyltransferase family protein [Bacteroidales bacterium]